MKKTFLYAILFAVLNIFANDSSIVKMAVFPDNAVFTVRKAVIPDGRDSLSFFCDEQFLKGSFSLWSKDVQFSIRNMPKKQFNADIYSNPNAAFANQEVVVTLKKIGSTEQTVIGKLIKIENPDNPYEIPSVIAVQDKVSKKTTYIRKHDIETIQAEKANFLNENVPAKQWIFSRRNTKNPLPFEFSYLTNSIAWQSSIELHLQSADKMSIIHNAALRNNGRKFDCPDFYLVSGSPEIATRNIWSLLCQNISPKRKSYTPAVAGARYAMNDMAMQSTAVSSISQSGDVFYRPLGRIAMTENESRLIKLQSADNVPYRTVTKWEIPASRNAYGRIISNNNQQSAFNALIFKNLCPSLLDSAPVAIYADGKLIMLTNLDINTPVNAERSIRLSTADSIECRIEEKELVQKRVQNIAFNNRRYIRCTIEATLKITSFRKQNTPFVIDYNFTGEFVKSENADGRLIQNTDAASLLNPNGKISFDLTLEPAASREIKITYTVLAGI